MPESPHRSVELGPVPVASSFFKRLRGLIGRSASEIGAGLWIPRCRSVHTFGMKVMLDIVFVDRDHEVVEVRAAVPPRRWIRGGRGVQGTLELPAGRAAELRLERGCRVEWVAI